MSTERLERPDGSQAPKNEQSDEVKVEGETYPETREEQPRGEIKKERHGDYEIVTDNSTFQVFRKIR